jgi:UDP-2-acetamido-2-deoxy-ribo-hexuluronate aminotransferase
MQFVDLKKQYQRYKDEIRAEMDRVLESAAFIRGPVVTELEEKLASYTGVEHAIGCASGTDALLIALMAKGVGPGDEVIVPDFTFIATAETVALLGAVPVFTDVDPVTCNIDPERIRENITQNTRGIIAVSLYGQCADLDTINSIAVDKGLWVIEDGAQSFGAEYKGKKSCSLTEIATTSFFPAKPLGCYGDGGAVFTDDDDLAEIMRMILNHGQEKRYRHAVVGINGRLDSLQAAVLLVKLRYFDEELKARQRAADRYTELLKDVIETPIVHEGRTSVWAQYTVRHSRRDEITAELKEREIPTAVHYPVPLHKQKAFADAENTPRPSVGPGTEAGLDGSCPVTEKLCSEVFSLPMHPFLTEKEIGAVVGELRKIGTELKK